MRLNSAYITYTVGTLRSGYLRYNEIGYCYRCERLGGSECLEDLSVSVDSTMIIMIRTKSDDTKAHQIAMVDTLTYAIVNKGGPAFAGVRSSSGNVLVIYLFMEKTDCYQSD